MRNTLRNLILTSLSAVIPLCAQGLVIPQAPDGAGWRFTVVLTNTTASDTTASLLFFQETAGGVPQSWTPPFVEPGVNLGALLLPGGSSLFLHSTGTAATLTQGWAQLVGSGVAGYVIYTFTSGQSSSDATAPAVTSASRILVPFDDTGNLGTELAVVNPNSSQVSISVNVKTSKGVVSTGLLTLPGEGQLTFAMPTQFKGTAGESGLAEFYTGTGDFAMIALRSNNNPSTGVFSFTSAPVYSETGPPIVSASTGGGSGGGGAVPAGDITFAGFTIGKITSSAGVTEAVGGQFAAYTPTEWNPPYAATKIPPYCSVLNTTYPTSGKFPFAPDLFLDAGKSLSLSGPSLPVADTSVPATQIPNVGQFYHLTLPPGTLVDGGTYTLGGAGGTQVEGFSVPATLPSGFKTNVNTITSINRAQPLTVTWTGSEFENVIIGVNSTTLSTTTISQVVVSCAVPASLNTYTIPTAALSHLLPIAANSTAGVGALSLGTAPAIQGSVSAESGENTTFTPNLVAGGKIKYGGFAPSYAVVQSVAIQ
jgi:hypothetical protein